MKIAGVFDDSADAERKNTVDRKTTRLNVRHASPRPGDSSSRIRDPDMIVVGRPKDEI